MIRHHAVQFAKYDAVRYMVECLFVGPIVLRDGATEECSHLANGCTTKCFCIG